MHKHRLMTRIFAIFCVVFISVGSVGANAETANPYYQNTNVISEELKPAEERVSSMPEDVNSEYSKKEEAKHDETKSDESKPEELKKEVATDSSQKEADGEETDTREDKQENDRQTKQEYTGSIKLNSKKLSMKVGEEYRLKVTLTKKNLSGKNVIFSSSNKKVVQVTKDGLLKAKNYGEATITASLGKAKASCKVTVTKEVKITISAAGDVTLSKLHTFVI